MKVKYGHVPEELIYILAAPRKIAITWDDVELEPGETPPIEEVKPAYVGDSTNKKTSETGRSWAKQTLRKLGTPPVEIIRKNEPITGLRVMGQDYRMNGARVYKVVDQDGHYFDFRDDILLDVLRTVGVSEGGILNGEYKWARIGSAMKLVRIGSEIHQAVENANVRVERKRISLKDVLPGNLYETKSGVVYLFAGWVRGWNTTCNDDFKYGTREAETYYANWHKARLKPNDYHLRQFVGQPKPPNPPRLEIPFGPYKERLWVKLDDHIVVKSPERQVEMIDKAINKVFQNKNKWQFQNGVNFSNPPVNGHLGEYPMVNICERVRKYALDAVLLKDLDAREEEKDPVLKARARLWEIAEWLKYGTVYEDGTEPHESHDAWATWMLSTEPK